MNLKPIVSVVMPIYNSEDYLDEAISSILNQTFTNFELLAINDASTDSSLDIIMKYAKKDERVVLINNKENIGFVKNLNNGIKQARGIYIARMDSDDISTSNRFELQVEFLNNNTEIGIVGSWVKELGTNKKFKYPLEHEEICKYLIYGSPFGHPAVMFRKDVIIDNDLFYNEEFKVAQDYELWSRILEVTKGANIPEELLLWRKHEKSRSETNKTLKFNNSLMIGLKSYRKFNNDLNGEKHIKKLFVIPKEKNYLDIEKTVDYISKINDNCDLSNDKYLFNKISKKVYIYCRNNVHLGPRVYTLFNKSKWSKAKISSLSKFKFLILSLIKSIIF